MSTILIIRERIFDVVDVCWWLHCNLAWRVLSPYTMNSCASGLFLAMRIEKQIEGYAPFLLDVAGVRVPDDMQGLSLKRLVTDAHAAPVRDAIFYHNYAYPHEDMVKRDYGIRTRQCRLIHFYSNMDTRQLHDLEKNPDDMHNLDDEPAYEEIELEWKLDLKALQEQYRDRSFLHLKEDLR